MQVFTVVVVSLKGINSMTEFDVNHFTESAAGLRSARASQNSSCSITACPLFPFGEPYNWSYATILPSCCYQKLTWAHMQ